jgi:hypothetical protein
VGNTPFAERFIVELLTIETLQLPYLNWDTWQNFGILSRSYKICHAATPPEWINNQISLSESKRDKLQWALTYEYLHSTPPLHPRRSLDQFYYPSLRDTDTRDSDQTVSKWTGSYDGMTEDGRDSAAMDSLVVMVDQLWLWVIDERK